jgi:hypothetical protein
MLTRGSLKGLMTGEKRERSSESLTETSASYMVSQRLLVLLVLVKLMEDVLAEFELLLNEKLPRGRKFNNSRPFVVTDNSFRRELSSGIQKQAEPIFEHGMCMMGRS